TPYTNGLFIVPVQLKIKAGFGVGEWLSPSLNTNFFFFYDYETFRLLAAPIYFREDMGIEEPADGVNFHCNKSAHGSQKKSLGPFEKLELQMIVNHDVGSGNQTKVPVGKTSKGQPRTGRDISINRIISIIGSSSASSDHHQRNRIISVNRMGFLSFPSAHSVTVSASCGSLGKTCHLCRSHVLIYKRRFSRIASKCPTALGFCNLTQVQRIQCGIGRRVRVDAMLAVTVCALGSYGVTSPGHSLSQVLQSNGNSTDAFVVCIQSDANSSDVRHVQSDSLAAQDLSESPKS
ncbi:hypothetical protein STEG23_008711, partial [Scotinomys teguina]